MKTALNLLAAGIFLAVANAGLGQPSITPTVSLQNRAVDISSNVSFAVTASGTGPFSFQWRLDGLDLAGRTQNTLALTNLQPADEGDYTVVITNVAGAVTSEAARLWVVPLASEFVKSNLTNQAGVRLPPARRWTLRLS